MNVDSLIYLERLKESINEICDDQSVVDTMEIYNVDVFQDILISEIEYYIESNVIERQDPTLDLEQFEKCFTSAVALYHLSNLEKRGIVESIFDIDCMETKYRLTPLGKSITIA